MRHFLLLVLITGTVWNAHAQAWELKKSADSIDVYTRTVNESPIKEFRAVGMVAASSSEILSILKDVASYPKWIEDVAYSETLESTKDSLSFYYQMNLPWPIKDRDLCLEMKIFREENVTTVKLTSNPGLVPPNDDFIRMLTVEGQWVITAIDEENSQVQHQFLADPEGSLPAWVVNLFAVDGPHQTMLNLREFVKTRE